VRDAVLVEVRAGAHEAEAGVPVGEIRLRVQHDRFTYSEFQRPRDEPRGKSLAARCCRRRHPADPRAAVGVGQYPQRREHRAVALGPHQPSRSLEVAAVQFRVRAPLLDDEHVNAQREDPVERCGVEAGERCVVHGDVAGGHAAEPATSCWMGG